MSFTGQRSVISCVTVKHDITDAEMEAALKTEENSPPRLILFFKEKEFWDAKVIGDNVILHADSKDISYALLVFLGSYYSFNIDYCTEYKPFLNILQTLIAHAKWTGPGAKRSNYVNTLQQLQDEIESNNILF